MYSDVENQYLYGSGGDKLSASSPVSIRHGFIRKVYGILGAQLFLTAMIACPFIFIEGARQFIRANPAFFIIVLVANIALMFTFACCSHVLRRYPTNYMMLGLFTMTEGVLVGVICSSYNTTIVLTAVLMTAVVVCGLSLFAMQTTYDFTSCGAYLFAFALGMMVFGLVLIFVPYTPFLHKLYAGLGVTLFSFYLVFDTQIIIGGEKRSFQLSIDDYCFGALMLYIDIIQMFLYILQLLGDRD